MALAETASAEHLAQIRPQRGYSRGDKHAALIRNGNRAKRLAAKHISASIDRLAKALESDNETAAVNAARELLDRAVGKPASDPQDSAIAGMAAAAFLAAMPADFLPQLLNMRHAALQQQPLDITPDATPALPQERK